MINIFNRKIVAVLFLGFSSGLPLALSGGTLQAWLTVEEIDIKTIGLFSLVGMPYTLKFLWSPLMDRYVIPILGRRRGWIIATQLILIGIIFWMSITSVQNGLWMLAFLAFLLTFISASQDIAIDAYRTEVLHEPERGLGVAVSVTGYRIAMLVSGALALILSEFIGWRATYMLMALIMLVGVIATWFGPEPDNPGSPPTSMREAVQGPFKEFFSRSGVWSLLGLIILYKMGDAFAGSLTTTFLIRGVNFSVGEVGAINKGMGLASTIIGALFGGILMARLRLFKSLLIFGIFQAISNLSFMFLAIIGKNYPLMIFTIAFENLAGGMGTAAFLAFLMALCDNRFTATQFALLSALASLGRIFVGPVSGVLVDTLGWTTFFFSTFLFALPGLLLLFFMKQVVIGIEKESSNMS